MKVRVRLLTGVFTVGLALAMSACGEDEDGATEASESGPGKEATTGAETPEELASCLQETGLPAEVIPPPAEGAPGAEFGSLGSVRVQVGQGNGVVAVFFASAEQAKVLAKEGSLTPQGATQVVGTTFLASNRGRPQELEAFRTCLKG